MPIVTIRGQLESGAPEIGKLIAKNLGIDYLDREIITKVALLLNCEEQEIIEKQMAHNGFLHHIADVLRHRHRSSFQRTYLPTWKIPLEDDRFFRALQSVIREIARNESIVINGQGSQFILRNNRQTTHILVIAPLNLRIKRVMRNLKVDEDTAKNEIKQFDDNRRQFIKKYFHAELEDPANYDFVINKRRLNDEDAACIAVKALSFS